MEGDGRRGGAVIEGISTTRENAAIVDCEMSEDEKIERFYALIKNYKEARERRRIELERASQEGEVEVDDEEEMRRKRKRTAKSGDRSAASSWTPAFKWEDFAECSQIRFRNSAVLFPNSYTNMHGGGGGDRLRVGRLDDPAAAEVDGGGLDLKLRL